MHRVAGYAAYACLELPAGAAPPSLPKVPGVGCRELALTEMARYGEDPVYEFDSSFIPEAMERGDCCMGVFAGDKLVSYSFNTPFATTFHPTLRYHFPEGSIYHFKAFTIPEWRGKRLHALNVAAALAKFRRQPGYSGLVTLVNEANHPSLRSFERLGFRVAHRFYVLRRESDAPWVLATGESGHHVERIN